MDIASLLGIILGVVMIVFGIVFDKNTGVEFSKLFSFIDIPSVIITIGGSLTSTLSSSTLPNFLNGLKSIKLAFQGVKGDANETISNVIELSTIARKEGLLALEEAATNLEDEFLKKGIMLVVDGTDPELVRGIMETELVCVSERHGKVLDFWNKLSEMGPAWGMIGTLIGLINMLKGLDDPSTIGPSMSVALLTTLYGSLIANWLCGPVSAKLKANSATEIMLKEVTVEGLLSIQAGENPRVIEEKLKSFLAPSQRTKVNEREGEE
ncbi:motility protein A [Anaerosacchariphilus polymeriproducens]|uniref:Motility protein A n=1 Tax=Anaerosacchariphilus polymeriproducens TaxID=1812858 RepID=A0A371AS85_9FIRM|nr:motility protein A [Anaerosacchariphilus polymeriproducens]RDU22427.1 motility protein A [Anaerosacchariphilus polymeriproducens]